MSRSLLVAAISLLALQACTTIHDVTESRDGARYRVGESASAAVGEVMLDRYHYSAAPVALPVAAIASGEGRMSVAAGARLVARRVDGERAYCSPIEANFACFYDNDNDSRFDHVLVTNMGITSSKRPLLPAAAYTLTDGTLAQGFKSELVYLGRSGQTIDVRYLDYTDDLARPTYQQDLHYTLDVQGAGEISYRAARLKVLAADNQRIRYEILSGFAD